MMHTKTRIGKKLNTKCRLCVILSIDCASKLKIWTDNKIKKKKNLKNEYLDCHITLSS
jgi:hypothetical protein